MCTLTCICSMSAVESYCNACGAHWSRHCRGCNACVGSPHYSDCRVGMRGDRLKSPSLNDQWVYELLPGRSLMRQAGAGAGLHRCYGTRFSPPSQCISTPLTDQNPPLVATGRVRRVHVA